MASKNYLKILEDGSTEAILHKPLHQLGERKREYAGDNPDILIKGKWWNSTNGDEKVINGTFSDGTTTGWISDTDRDSILSVVDGTLRVQGVASDGGYTYQAIPTTIGKEYIVSVTASLITSSGWRIRLGTTSALVGDVVERPLSNSSGTDEVTFTAVSTTTYLILRCDEANTNNITAYDNVSVFETEILPDTEYVVQPTYVSKDGKLASFLIEDGQPVEVQYNDDAPSIVQDVIQAKKVVQTENRKIIELGTIFNNNRYRRPNPFGNENWKNCSVELYLEYQGTWFQVAGQPASGSTAEYYGAMVSSMEEGIVVQTAVTRLTSGGSAYTLNTLGISTSLTSAPAMVIVTYEGESK